MGYPVSHSRSPVIHRLFALQTNQELQYELLQVAPDKLETAVRQFQRTGGKGLNITVPHKSAVVKLCDHLSERANTAGAVNTLSFRDSEIDGDNTDGIGLVEHFAHSGPVSACRFNVVPVTEKYDLIINATSAGYKGEAPPYPAAAVSSDTLCYDLSYGLKATPFSEWARDQGAERSVMGWGMLVEQAAESFNIWRGVRPDTAPVLKQMKIMA
jgi:shikimate dehydrogenase